MFENFESRLPQRISLRHDKLLSRETKAKVVEQNKEIPSKIQKQRTLRWNCRRKFLFHFFFLVPSTVSQCHVRCWGCSWWLRLHLVNSAICNYYRIELQNLANHRVPHHLHNYLVHFKLGRTHFQGAYAGLQLRACVRLNGKDTSLYCWRKGNSSKMYDSC